MHSYMYCFCDNELFREPTLVLLVICVGSIMQQLIRVRTVCTSVHLLL